MCEVELGLKTQSNDRVKVREGEARVYVDTGGSSAEYSPDDHTHPHSEPDPWEVGRL